MMGKIHLIGSVTKWVETIEIHLFQSCSLEYYSSENIIFVLNLRTITKCLASENLFGLQSNLC